MSAPADAEDTSPRPVARIGRYLVFDEIASGGMATVHFGKLEGASGFARVVALKRLHAQYAKTSEAASMLRDEAWLSARVRHANVVGVTDVVEEDGELVLVMEYVEGTSLARVLAGARHRNERLPAAVCGALLSETLAGLEAAHRATGEDGAPLTLIHRDVSPQNILVGFDGVARLTDFGIAKARGRAVSTEDGQLKGKLAYMAPEQATGKPLTPRTDIYAAGVVLWEALTGERLNSATEAAEVIMNILYKDVPSVREVRPELGADVDALLGRALARAPEDRFASAAEMGAEVERVLGRASAREVADFLVTTLGREVVDATRARREAIERASTTVVAPPLSSRMRVAGPASIDDPPPVAPVSTRDATGAHDATALSRDARTRRGRGAWAGLAALALAVVAGASTVQWRSSRRPSSSSEAASATGTVLASASVSAGVAAPASASDSAPIATHAASAGPSADPKRRRGVRRSPVAAPVTAQPPPTASAGPKSSVPSELVGIPHDRE